MLPSGGNRKTEKLRRMRYIVGGKSYAMKYGFFYMSTWRYSVNRYGDVSKMNKMATKIKNDPPASFGKPADMLRWIRPKLGVWALSGMCFIFLSKYLHTTMKGTYMRQNNQEE